MIASAILGAVVALAPFTPPIALNVFAGDVLLVVAAGAVLRQVRPPWWLLAIAAAVGITTIWSAEPLASGMAAVRILAVGTVGLWLAHRGSLNPFLAGAAVTVVFNATVVGASMWSGRAWGLAPTISTMGVIGMCLWIGAAGMDFRQRWLAWATWAVGIVSVVGPIARSPIVALGLFTGARKRLWVPLGVTVALFVAVTVVNGGGERLTLSGIRSDAERRAATIDGGGIYVQRQGAPEWDWRGVGFNAFVAAHGWPRPHNAYVLAWYELGVFMIVPASIILWLGWRERWLRLPLIAFAVYGFLDDSMLHPAGVMALLFALVPPLLSTSSKSQAAQPGD